MADVWLIDGKEASKQALLNSLLEAISAAAKAGDADGAIKLAKFFLQLLH